jgi:hypothetical protein
MDKLAICAIFKDEAPYLLEWLAFHRMIGIDLLVLHDNGINSEAGVGSANRKSRSRLLQQWYQPQSRCSGE